MNEIHTSRFKDAPWFKNEETNVIVGGAGGIGSWLTVLLTRAGFTPIVYDFDRIEEHNLAGQMYTKRDAVKNIFKVDALKENCKEFSDTVIHTNIEKYTEDSMSHNYVFSAYDNMQARKDTFTAWKNFVKDWKDTLESTQIVDVEVTEYNVVLEDTNNNKLAVVKLLKDLNTIGLLEAKHIADAVSPGVGEDGEPYVVRERIDIAYATTLKARFDEIGAITRIEPVIRIVKEVQGIPTDTPIFIDGRLRAEQMQIFCVTPNRIEEYEKHLFDDSEVEDAPCTLKQTSHSAAMIGAHMTAFFTNHLTNNYSGDIDRTVPFLWEYFIPLDYLKVE